jgi:hypothetical protein
MVIIAAGIGVSRSAWRGQALWPGPDDARLLPLCGADIVRSAFGAGVPRPGAFDADGVSSLLDRSAGTDGREFLSPQTLRWLAGLRPQVPERFVVHHDAAARRAASALGVTAFARGHRIVLGAVPAAALERVLRHELVHLAQVQLALHTGRVASRALVEAEAETLSALPVARPVLRGADPEANHAIFWFIAIGVGLYVLLRPGVANAPKPGDRIDRSPSQGQLVAEAICTFAVPGGAFSLGGRLGLGFLGSAALAGAAGNVSLRAVGDVASGGLSTP